MFSFAIIVSPFWGSQLSGCVPDTAVQTVVLLPEGLTAQIGDGVSPFAALHMGFPDEFLFFKFGKDGIQGGRAEAAAACGFGFDPCGDVNAAFFAPLQGHEYIEHTLGQDIQRLLRHGCTSNIVT